MGSCALSEFLSACPNSLPPQVAARLFLPWSGKPRDFHRSFGLGPSLQDPEDAARIPILVAGPEATNGPRAHGSCSFSPKRKLRNGWRSTLGRRTPRPIPFFKQSSFESKRGALRSAPIPIWLFIFIHICVKNTSYAFRPTSDSPGIPELSFARYRNTLPKSSTR